MNDDYSLTIDGLNAMQLETVAHFTDILKGDCDGAWPETVATMLESIESAIDKSPQGDHWRTVAAICRAISDDLRVSFEQDE